MKRIFIPAVFSLLSACAYQNREVPVSFLGNPAPLNSATQSIAIQPDTKWINVTGGDTARFIAGGKEFAWTFDVAMNVDSFELNRIAPPGMLDHRVEVYVAPDPRYIGP